MSSLYLRLAENAPPRHRYLCHMQNKYADSLKNLRAIAELSIFADYSRNDIEQRLNLVEFYWKEFYQNYTLLKEYFKNDEPDQYLQDRLYEEISVDYRLGKHSLERILEKQKLFYGNTSI
ncbi:hypothetical protein TKK_0015201 [Trichogramma kaykai]